MSQLGSEIVRVQRYGKARHVRHRETDTYTGVPEPDENPRVLVDKHSTETCTVLNTKGDTVQVYSAETAGSVVASLSEGQSHTVTTRRWLQSSGTSLVKIERAEA